MDTVTTPLSGYAVVEENGLPGTAGYVPIIVGPKPPEFPRVGGVLGPYTFNMQISTSDPSYNGNTMVDVQFFGVNEDASGNIWLTDQVAQIPDTNPGGGNNRKQSVALGTASNPTPVPVYVVPNSQAIAIMVVARPRGGGSFGNVGVYWFDVPTNNG